MKFSCKILVSLSVAVLSACNTTSPNDMSTNDKIMSLAAQQDTTHIQSAETEKYFTVSKMLDDVRGKSKLSRLKGHPDYYLRLHYSQQEAQLSTDQRKQLDDMIQLLSPTKKYRVRVEAGISEANKSLASYLSEERLIIVKNALKPHFTQIDGFTRKNISANELVIQFTAEPLDNKKG